MAILKIDNFGGEMPSVSPRALPPQAAQVNQNLFLPSPEFRPLASDLAVAACPVGTKTLYRAARDTTGALQTSASSGWVTKPIDASYVRGQINDDREERTYWTTNDGSAPPRACNAANMALDRLLGVPPPAKPAPAHTSVEEFTSTEARTYLYGSGAAAMSAAITANILDASNNVLDASRVVEGTTRSSTAGPSQAWGMYWADSPVSAFSNQPYFLSARIPRVDATTMGLDYLGELGAKSDPLDGTLVQIPFLCLPFVYRVNRAPALLALKALVYPTDAGSDRAGQRVLTDTQAESLIDAAIGGFNPDNYAKRYRAHLERLTKEFVTILAAKQPGSAAKLIALQAEAAAVTDEANKAAVKLYEAIATNLTGITNWLDTQGGTSELVPDTVERLVETRSYVATFVTDWEEESSPSEPCDTFDLDQNDTVTVPCPTVPSGRNITKWRLYRTNTGTNSAAFQFVKEATAGTSIADDVDAEDLGEACPTTTWLEPPTSGATTNQYLRGLVGMPNGVMAGFFDSTVAFCEPFVPYAWPVEYQIALESPVVGMGVFGQTLFVGTVGHPYFISGADSMSMSAQKLEIKQACASAKSIASMQGGVLYASPDGLCLADPNGIRVVSTGLYTREDWQKLNPAMMFGVSHENVYYLFYTGSGGGCLMFDIAASKLGRVSMSATAAFSDTGSDTLYIADGESIKAVYGGTGRRTAKWKSGKITLPLQQPFAWLRALGDITPEAPVVVRWIGDGQLVYTKALTSIDPVRLPSGRYLEHEIEVESSTRVTQVGIYGSLQEVQSV